MKRYRVAVVEPSHIIAEGLRSILSATAEFDVVFTAPSWRTLEDRWGVVQPDVVVVGSQAECGGSLRAKSVDWHAVALVALQTTVREEEWLRQADGVINIYDDHQQIVQRLRRAMEQSETNPYNDSHELSEREQAVLVLVAKGLTNKEIADRLNISVHTVISHRKNITHKTGIKSVAGLTVYALLNNLLDQSDCI